MDADGHSGFRHAPVTKFLVPVVGVSSALATFFNTTSLEITQLSVQGQLWRLFTSQWAFSSIGTSVIGTWLIYRLRIVERRYGSAKYAAFVFITFMASTMVQTSAFWVGFKSMAGGPYAILFAILCQFHQIVPVTYQTPMFGLEFTDKTYAYLAATQLLLSNSGTAIIPAVTGIVMGSVYRQTKAIQQWRFPGWIRAIASKYFVGTYQKKNRSRPASPRLQQTVIVEQEDINTMLAMFPNYSRQEVERALISSSSDLNRAAEILLSSEPSAGSSS
ncbi:hypothetical protein EDC96DRAFT_496436 [Choanephora cucurbitarum]|nr:hypothetical protein EDC96DRAFT_496436 [Choanephora cucurbitarum]